MRPVTVSTFQKGGGESGLPLASQTEPSGLSGGVIGAIVILFILILLILVVVIYRRQNGLSNDPRLLFKKGADVTQPDNFAFGGGAAPANNFMMAPMGGQQKLSVVLFDWVVAVASTQASPRVRSH